jgi:lipoprotein-anchoring transpeptidase ErfK/SrfK
MKKDKKLIVTIVLTILIMLGFIALLEIKVKAEFDPNYYARKYPDVVNAIGNDPEALRNHYNTCGIKEGRFQNQQEETENFLAILNGTIPANNSVTSTLPEVTINEPIQAVNTPEPATTTQVNIVPIAGMSTYVDVSIADQTMTYFENGEIKLQSPCVTGNVNRGRGTPTGTYSIMRKVPGKYLVGPTWRCWVNRWMQFTPSNIGLHDATWRGSFGGDIYTYDGSHGCVNLPNDVAIFPFLEHYKLYSYHNTPQHPCHHPKV